MPNIVYPENQVVFNVLDYGADPSGQFESTAAFQAAFDAQYGRAPVYIPNGRYWINPLYFSAKSYEFIQGQDPEKVILFTKPGSSAFSDVNNPQALLNFNFQNSTPGQAFSNFIENVTIINGEDNPGFEAMRFIGANTSGIYRVRIETEGAAHRGINFFTPDNCCTLIQDCSIKGAFKEGINFEHYSDNAVIDGLYLEGMTDAGIAISATFHVTISGLESHLKVPVIRSEGGTVEVINSEATYTGNGTQTAFVDADYSTTWTGARTFLQGLTIEGYAKAYEHKTDTGLSFDSIQSWEEKGSFALLSNKTGNSGRIPFADIRISTDNTEYPLEDWIVVPPASGGDDYQNIQMAINTNLDAKVLAFTFGGDYKHTRPIKLPKESQIEMIIGNCFLKPQNWAGRYGSSTNVEPIFYIEPSEENKHKPLLIKGFEAYTWDVTDADFVHNPGGRTLVIEDVSSSSVRQKGGYLFVKTCCLGLKLYGVKCSAINLNPEGNTLRALDYSEVYVLGSKSETGNQIYQVANRSVLSVIGLHHLGNANNPGVPMATVDATSELFFVGATGGSNSHDIIVQKDGQSDITFSGLPSGATPFPSKWKARYSNF